MIRIPVTIVGVDHRPIRDVGQVEMCIDHDGCWVYLELERDKKFLICPSLSPAEAKVLATALTHYAERAQKSREDER